MNDNAYNMYYAVVALVIYQYLRIIMMMKLTKNEFDFFILSFFFFSLVRFFPR